MIFSFREEGILYFLAVASLEILQVLVEGLEVFYVVLGIREIICYLFVNACPAEGYHLDLLKENNIIMHLVVSLVNKVVNGTALLVIMRLVDLSQFSRALLPLFEFTDRAIISIKAACFI